MKIIAANETFAAMVGRDPVNLIGVDVDEITHPDDRGKGKNAVDAIGDGEQQRVRQAKRYITPDGRAVWAMLHSEPVYFDSENIPEFFLSFIVERSERQSESSKDELRKMQAEIDGMRQEYFQLLLATRQQTSVHVGDVMSQRIKADRGASVSAQTNSTRVFLVVAVVIAAIGVAAFRGNLSFSSGDTQVEVNGDDQ